MVSKKSAARARPMVLASAPAAASATRHGQRSAILRSAFSPARLGLSLFASVIHGFDGQLLRVHDTVSGRLRWEHAAGTSTVACLSWGAGGSSPRAVGQQPSKKRRKVLDDANGAGSDAAAGAVVAYGTHRSEIHLIALDGTPAQVLRDGHTLGIRDFRFVGHGLSEAWSVGGDGRLVQWDVRMGQKLRTIPVEPLMNLLLPMPSAVLCASSTKAHLVDLKTQRITHTFDGAKNELHGLVASKSDQHSLPASFLAAAESDRYLNIISMKSGQIIGTLVAGDDVVSLAAADHPEAEDTRAVAVVTKLGDVQVFQSPFDMEKSSANSTQSTSLKHGRTVPKPQRPTASVTVTRPGKGEATVPVFNVSFDGDDLVVVWTEGGAGLGFGRLPWRQSEDGDLLLRGETQIQGHMVGQLAAAAVNGIKELGRVRVDESHAVIAKGSQMDDVSMAIDGPEVIDISSGEEVEEGEESEAEDRDREQVHVNGAHHGDTEMEDAMPDGGEEAEKDDPDAAPSFGDLARANALDVIDVEASFADPDPQSVVRHGESAPKPPSGMSLFNVLKQSLRTDDNNLLEGCFHVKDFDIIRTTIERLDSSLASILLQKIAEKFHQKPGRARSLMVWIQWTMVCHGGYLLSQESVKNKLAALHRVVKVRADALAPLLALKGKLDMLEAQASLRRSMQSRVGKEDTGDEEEDGVIYVEGQHDSDSESDDSRSDTSHPAMVGRQLLGNGHESARRDDGDSDEDVEEASTAMSMAVEDSDEDSDEEDSGSEGHGLIDDEASESDDAADEELLAGEIDYDDVDSDGDEDSEADAPKAKTRDQPRLANGTSRKRK